MTTTNETTNETTTVNSHQQQYKKQTRWKWSGGEESQHHWGEDDDTRTLTTYEMSYKEWYDTHMHNADDDGVENDDGVDGVDGVEDDDDVENDDTSEYPDYEKCTHDFPFMNLTKEEREKKSDAFKFGHHRLGAFAIMCNACHKYYTSLQVETI